MTSALGQARWVSRGIALTSLGASATSANRHLQEAITLGALAFGMPHGAADTELLKRAANGSRVRQVALTAAYAATAAAATVGIRRGGSRTSQLVLAASAIHFAEGELATWQTTGRRPLRAAAAAFATVLLPAAVTTVNRRHDGQPRKGLQLLNNPILTGTTAISAVLSAALLATGDVEAGLDTALLGTVALAAPPAIGFATYFGGWHSLRHTARVIDSLVEHGLLPADDGLVGGAVTLTRRSAWAAAVGILAAGLLVAVDPDHASDNAFAAVLGLTVPHMTTVALTLGQRRASVGMR